jgi:hypothetical protein
MAPSSIFASLPAALQALQMHLPCRKRQIATPASKLSTKLRPLQQDPASTLRSLVARAVDLQAEIDSLQPRPGLTGAWRKDREASDDMAEACDMVALPWVLRKALAVLNRLEVEDTDAHFATNLKAGGLMDVVERYPWSAEQVAHSRRDKRRGQHTGRVTRTAEGRPCIEVTWENPHGGECADTLVLSPDGNTLTQVTAMHIRDSGRRTAYKTVYRRIRSGGA